MHQRLIAAAAVASAVLAGCGGGSSNKTLSYSDFGTQMGNICQGLNPQVKAETAKLTGKASADAAVYDTIIPKLEDGVNQVKALKAPSELKPHQDTWVSISQQQIALAKKAQAATKAGDQKGYVAVLLEIKKSKLGAKGCIGS